VCLNSVVDRIRIRILLFSWFWILHKFFSNILDINFTFVFLPCNCVLGCSLWRDIGTLFREIFFWQKGIYIFKLSIFVKKLSNFCQCFRVVLLHIHLGSAAAWIRNELGYILILIKVMYRIQYCEKKKKQFKSSRNSAADTSLSFTSWMRTIFVTDPKNLTGWQYPGGYKEMSSILADQ
jgi:hypothetical protein